MIFNLLGFFLFDYWNYFLLSHVLGPLHYHILAVSYVASSMSYKSRDCPTEFHSYIRISKIANLYLNFQKEMLVAIFLYIGFFFFSFFFFPLSSLVGYFCGSDDLSFICV